MSNFEELNEKFYTIKEMAWRGESFTRYHGVNGKPDDEKERLGYSLINMYFLETMKHIYARHRLKQLDKGEGEKEVEALRLKYISEKQAEEARARGYREFQEKRRNISQWSKQLMKPEGKSVKKLFRILFCELIPALTDEVTGRKIKEGVGYVLLTGSYNLTEEEKKELRERYG